MATRRESRPSRSAREYRLQLLQTYLDREGQADAIVKATERDLVALLLSREITPRTLPAILKEYDRILDQQEEALLALIDGGLRDAARATADRSIAAQ